MRRGLLFIATFLFINSLSAQNSIVKDSIPMGLHAAWSRADQYSKELQLKQSKLKQGKEHLKDEQQNWLPDLKANASYGKLTNIPIFVDGILNEPDYYPLDDHTTYDANIDASFDLYHGKKKKLKIEKAGIEQDVLSYLKDATRSDVHYRVAVYYLGALRAMAFEKIIEHNIAESKKRLSQIQVRYKNGAVLKSDLLRAKLRLSQQQTKLTRTKNSVTLAIQQLNMLIGYDDNQPLILTDQINDDLASANLAYDKYVETVLKQSPFEQIAKKQIDLSKINLRDVKANKLPHLSLFGNYTYAYPQTRLYPYSSSPYGMGEVGIKISYRFSSLYRNKHKENVAALSVESQNTARENVEDKLRSRTQTAYLRMQEDLENLQVDKTNIQQASESYRIENQTYFNKLALLTDLLSADTQLMQARFDLINDYISARLHYYQLLKLTGQL